MNTTAYKYVFGPVYSRRLGRSLGIDLVPFKTCTLDCVYCQLGPTTTLTSERAEYVPLDAVIAELKRKAEDGLACDWITLAGSGEPTLHSRLGELIAFIKGLTDTPIAVITNGTLLWREDVQEELLGVDLVIPSLDAGTPATFQQINQPDASLSLDTIVEGLVSFRERFTGKIWLEVLLVGGGVISDEEVEALRNHIVRINPDRVQLNTVVRPSGTEKTITPLPQDQMNAYAAMLGDKVEVIADYTRIESAEAREGSADDVLALLQRHPCSLDDVTHGLGISEDAAKTHLKALVKTRAIVEERRDDRVFYIVKQ